MSISDPDMATEPQWEFLQYASSSPSPSNRKSLSSRSKHIYGSGKLTKRYVTESIASFQQRILLLIQRLDDKDTRHASTHELTTLCQSLHSQSLGILINCLCGTISLVSKPIARTTILTLFGVLCSHHKYALHSPMNQSLSSSYMESIIASILSSSQHNDVHVRLGAAHAVSILCNQSLSLNDESMKLLSSLLRSIFRQLSTGTPSSKGGAAMMLLSILVHTPQTLLKPTLTRIYPIVMRYVNHRAHDNCEIHCSMIDAAAHLMCNEASKDEWLPHLFASILCALRSQLWRVREAAANAMTFIGQRQELFHRYVDEMMTTSKLEAIEALMKVRHDRIANVRNAVLRAIDVWDTHNKLDRMNDVIHPIVNQQHDHHNDMNYKIDDDSHHENSAIPIIKQQQQQQHQHQQEYPKIALPPPSSPLNGDCGPSAATMKFDKILKQQSKIIGILQTMKREQEESVNELNKKMDMLQLRITNIEQASSSHHNDDKRMVNNIVKTTSSLPEKGLWSIVNDYIQCNQVNEAIKLVLSSNDYLQIIRLLTRTGIPSTFEPGSTLHETIIQRLIEIIITTNSFQDTILPWILTLLDVKYGIILKPNDKQRLCSWLQSVYNDSRFGPMAIRIRDLIAASS